MLCAAHALCLICRGIELNCLSAICFRLAIAAKKSLMHLSISRAIGAQGTFELLEHGARALRSSYAFETCSATCRDASRSPSIRFIARHRTALRTRMSAAQVNEQRRKEIQQKCTKEAWQVGGKSALTALGLAGAAVGGANYFFHGFRTSLGVSGKAALVVSSNASCMQAPST